MAAWTIFQRINFTKVLNTAAHREGPTGLVVSNSKGFLFLRMSHEYTSDGSMALRRYQLRIQSVLSRANPFIAYAVSSDLDLWMPSVLSLMTGLKNGLGWQIGSPATSV